MEAPAVSDKIYKQPDIMPAAIMPPKLNGAYTEAMEKRAAAGDGSDCNAPEIIQFEAIPVEEAEEAVF